MRRTRLSGLGWLLAIGWGIAAGCGGTEESGFKLGGGDDSGAGSDGSKNGEGGVVVVEDDGGKGGDAAVAIAVEPANAIIDVAVIDGVPTIPAATSFTAKNLATGAVVSGVTWDVDRGELATIGASSGALSAKGMLAGTATVSAQIGGVRASATATIRISSVSAGPNATSGTGPQTGTAPAGGFNGVGGQVLGPAPTQTIRDLLKNTTNVVPAAQFEWLYPYDQTVFPRAMLAPLVQWRTQAAGGGAFNVTGYYVHLKQAGFEFEGYYAKDPAGNFLTSQPIDAEVWKRMVGSNPGGDLEVEIKVTDGTTVYGPLKRTWKVAPGILRGTVYYASYGTLLADITQSNKAAGVLRIKPGDFEPTLAVPGAKTKCVVCHEVANDGATLFSNDTSTGTYGNARAFDLKNGAAEIRTYSDYGKFSYSGPSPSGSMILASSGEGNYHEWASDSNLFDTSTSPAAAIATTGWTDTVKKAVTPSFSNDGARVSFTFDEAQAGAAPTLAAMADGGHTLVAADFNCNQTSSGGACGAPPYAFTDMRQLFRDTTARVGWPSFTPDSKWVIFQRSTRNGNGAPLNTTNQARADLWIANTEKGTTFQPMKLCALSGLSADCNVNGGTPTSYLPAGPNHPQFLVDDQNPGDTNLQFEPTLTPIVSGGYFWVMFTTRRLYGNVATLEPYAGKDDGKVMPADPVPKKLWIAAIDINPKPGVDPSHPAFYLPGQELRAGNMRGFWVNDPCKSNGNGCETGDECCNGFCREAVGGGLMCTDKPAQGCANEFETCKTKSDCCGALTGIDCIGGKCARGRPN